MSSRFCFVAAEDAIRGGAICAFDFHGEKCEALADVVVQISCDAAAFLLLGFDELTTYFCEGLLGELLIGCVDCGADESSERSIAVDAWGCDVEHPTVDPVASKQTVLLREWFFDLQGLTEGFQHTFTSSG